MDADATGRYPIEIEAAVYFAALEALQNAAKYANAGEISIAIQPTDGEWRFSVRDDGVGFDPNGSFPGHLGLRSMRERAATLGGTLEIDSAPGAGTTIRARIPAHGSPT
jgi:signal transduction histidine kinase